jgi:hypothetical protein
MPIWSTTFQSEKEVTHYFNKDFFQIKQNTNHSSSSSSSSSSPVTVIEPDVHSTSTLTQFDSFHAFVFFKTKGNTNQKTPIRHFGGAFTHRSVTRTRYSRQHMLEVNWKCTARALVLKTDPNDCFHYKLFCIVFLRNAAFIGWISAITIAI